MMCQKTDVKKDKVNELFLRLKYGKINDKELEEFTEKISKMIWKTIHNSYVNIPKEDIYQEIWYCVLANAQNFDESRGTSITTYIWRICLSVIGQYKYDFKKDNTVAITDFVEKQEQADTFFEKKLSEKTKSYVPEKLGMIDDYVNALTDEMDRNIINLAIRPTPEAMAIINSDKKNKKRKLAKKDIVRLLGISMAELESRLVELKKIYFDKLEKVDYDNFC